MSFNCCKTNTGRLPGAISGNPVSGLCEKACISVNRVFDACLYQDTAEGLTLTLENPTPPTYTAPLTFVNGSSTSSVGTVNSLVITPMADNSGLSRIQANVCIPMQAAYTDAAGVEGAASGTVCVPVDVLLCVPTNSLIPASIQAAVNVAVTRGTYVDGLTFTVTACITIILKVVAEVQLLVPSYGYCQIPPCQSYTEGACTGVFELPIFPR